jgi:hypothetical protein
MRSARSTPLHLAARNGHAAVVSLLLKYGADINATTETGTALHEVSISETPRLTPEASPFHFHAPQAHTQKPAHLLLVPQAALYGKSAVVKLLLDSGINAHARNALNQTAMEFLERIPKTKAQDIRTMLSLFLETDTSPHVRKALATMTYTPGVYDTEALSFRKGDVVTVLDTNSSGWWRGQLGTKEGVFPHTYVGESCSEDKMPVATPICPTSCILICTPSCCTQQSCKRPNRPLRAPPPLQRRRLLRKAYGRHRRSLCRRRGNAPQWPARRSGKLCLRNQGHNSRSRTSHNKQCSLRHLLPFVWRIAPVVFKPRSHGSNGGHLCLR